jgi:hypothetical protein
MSLPASQRRALNQIEETLANDHPGLGPMFAIFTRLTGHEAMPLTEQVTARPWLWPRRWPQRLRPAVVTLIGLAMATGALLTLSLLLPGPQACAPGSVSPVAAQTQPVPIGRPRTCPTQQDKTSETSGSGLYTP